AFPANVTLPVRAAPGLGATAKSTYPVPCAGGLSTNTAQGTDELTVHEQEGGLVPRYTDCAIRGVPSLPKCWVKEGFPKVQAAATGNGNEEVKPWPGFLTVKTA